MSLILPDIEEQEEDKRIPVKFDEKLRCFTILDAAGEIFESFSTAISGRFIAQRAHEIQEDNSIIIYDAFGVKANQNDQIIIS